MYTARLCFAAVALSVGASAHAGILLDYGYDESFNDAGVVRGDGGRASGFDQFQMFVVPDAPWRLDSATLHLRLWNVASAGDAEVAIFAADGQLPDFGSQVSGAFALRADSQGTEPVLVDLGGVVLTSGTYYVGLVAADPSTDVLWMPGDANAARHAVRSDGRVFTQYNPALSLTLDGEVVPAGSTAAALSVAGVTMASRRR